VIWCGFKKIREDLRCFIKSSKTSNDAPDGKKAFLRLWAWECFWCQSTCYTKTF